MAKFRKSVWEKLSDEQKAVIYAKRFRLLKAMNTIMYSANDEDIYYAWIETVPDEATDEELFEIVHDNEIYVEACNEFSRLYAYVIKEESGLYIWDDLVVADGEKYEEVE